jgi:glycosyltransferase involved in cell wall biosynthesis
MARPVSSTRRDGDPPCVAFCANTLRYLWNFRRSTLQRFLDQGVRVVCIGQEGPDAEKLRAIGCEVTGLDWRLRSLNPVHELGVVRQIHAVLRKTRPAVVFSFTFKANFAVSLACLPLGIPYVTNVSGLGTAFLEQGLAYRLIRRLYGFANGRAFATFFQNNSDVALFRASKLSTGRRMAVLPGSGVDTAHFTAEPLDRPVRTFVMISRLIRDKGVGEYLEAARAAKAQRPDLRFLLVGPEETDGPGRIPADQVRAVSEVEYLGELSDVRPVLTEADCLVLPSYREGMPRTVLEAAAMARPSLVSDVEGCRDAIEPGVTGMLFAPRSAAALSEALLAIAARPAGEIAEMSRAARALAQERFGEELCIAPYEAIFTELTAGSRS